MTKPTLVIRQGKKDSQDFDIKDSREIVKTKILLRPLYGNKDTSYLHYHESRCQGTLTTQLVKRLTPEQLKQRDNDRRKDRLKNKQRVSAPRLAVEVPEHLRPFINLWRQYGGQKHLNETTKGFGYGIRALRKLTEGIMFLNASLPDNMRKWRKHHRFSLKEFEISLKNFYIAKTSPEYFPVNKSNLKGMTLSDFIYQAFVKNKYSPFLRHLEDEPLPIVSSKDPKLTKLLISYYQENVLGTSKYNPSIPERQRFAEASDRLLEFFKENGKNIAPGFPLDRPRIVRWLFEAIKSSRNGLEGDMVPGHLCSNLTFEQRLPSFLTSQAIFRDRHTLL